MTRVTSILCYMSSQ